MAKRARGERAGLTRDQILDAALTVLDRDGLAALTMRRLGAELGVEAMTLYHHVPNKEALLDGLVERIFSTAMPLTGPAAQWRQQLRALADDLRLNLLRHPAVLPVVVRPAVTAAVLETLEQGLRMLTEAGFPLGRAVDVLNALTLFVIGHTAAEAELGTTEGPGGVDWLEQLGAERFPLIVAAAQAGAGTDDLERFHFAVDAMLAGFAASLDPIL